MGPVPPEASAAQSTGDRLGGVTVGLGAGAGSQGKQTIKRKKSLIALGGWQLWWMNEGEETKVTWGVAGDMGTTMIWLRGDQRGQFVHKGGGRVGRACVCVWQEDWHANVLLLGADVGVGSRRDR